MHLPTNNTFELSQLHVRRFNYEQSTKAVNEHNNIPQYQTLQSQKIEILLVLRRLYTTHIDAETSKNISCCNYLGK